MKTARRSKAGFLLKIAILAFAVYFVIAFVQLQLDLQKKQQTLSEVQAACEQQKLSNEEKQAFLDDEDNVDYYERIAREKLGYVGAGERVFIDKSGN